MMCRLLNLMTRNKFILGIKEYFIVALGTGSTFRQVELDAGPR